jgi:hypothetical protein
VADAYSSGPIVFLSSYDIGKEKPEFQIKEAIDRLNTANRNRNREDGDGDDDDGRKHNYGAILSRNYIDALGGDECGTDDKNGVDVCAFWKKASHRCMGNQGAHPDLIAFDVQEALYSLLEDD